MSWMKKLVRGSNGNKAGHKKARSPSTAAAAAPASDTTPNANSEHHVAFPPQTTRNPGSNQRDHNDGYKFPAQGDGASQGDGDQPGTRSVAPTLNTLGDTANSEAGMSKSATTSATLGQGAGSIFSSSNHSQRSLSTTLTTIQSTAPSGHINHVQQASGTPGNGPSHQPTHSSHPSQSSTYFSHQYPTTPASAVPVHVTQSFLPTTYRSATANNLLSDNASVLTLASSSHNRRRRGSIDTDASVRAIPPSSTWGGSRESLPLSTLSTTTDLSPNTVPGGGLYQQSSSRPSMGGLASAERQSVYSSSGITANPVLPNSERNSLHAVSRSNTMADATSLRGGGGDSSSLRADGLSIRSGMHGRNDSIAGSINALGTSGLKNAELAEDE